MPCVPTVPNVPYMKRVGTWGIRLFIGIFSNVVVLLLEAELLSDIFFLSDRKVVYLAIDLIL